MLAAVPGAGRVLDSADYRRVAGGLADAMIAHFRAPVGFFDPSDDHETLITRPRELQDNAAPSGSAMAALVLSRLVGLAVEPCYVDLARVALGPGASYRYGDAS
jgi:uncharacterized protein YyaL (SSP411 family)